jgi:hypothetical protein
MTDHYMAFTVTFDQDIRTLIDVCKDLQEARALLEKTAWLRKPEKKAKK